MILRMRAILLRSVPLAAMADEERDFVVPFSEDPLYEFVAINGLPTHFSSHGARCFCCCCHCQRTQCCDFASSSRPNPDPRSTGEAADEVAPLLRGINRGEPDPLQVSSSGSTSYSPLEMSDCRDSYEPQL